MEHHHFQWVNQLFLWAMFDSKLLNYQRVIHVDGNRCTATIVGEKKGASLLHIFPSQIVEAWIAWTFWSPRRTRIRTTPRGSGRSIAVNLRAWGYSAHFWYPNVKSLILDRLATICWCLRGCSWVSQVGDLFRPRESTFTYRLGCPSTGYKVVRITKHE